jgi:hypothetical protein
VGQWAAEIRDSKRNELLKPLMHQLREGEHQLGSINDLTADIARAVYREGEVRRDYFLGNWKGEASYES